MRSIGARLIFWYALCATATLACLFVVGYNLLETRLINGLDFLNRAEFKQIQARLEHDAATLDPQTIDRRIRETTDYASVLFFINIDSDKTRNIFYSTNLKGQPIPDVKGQSIFNAVVNGVGELRVGEFFLPPFDISIGTPMGQLREVMQEYVEVCFALLAGMLLISVAIGWGLSRLVLHPVRLIQETASRIGLNNLSERIPVSDVQDEISDLTRLLNKMFDRLESAFDQTRRFAAEASHELKTPLSLVRLYAEKMIQDGNLAPGHEDALSVQLEELARLNRIIDELLFLSRAEANAIQIDLQPRDPAKCIESFAVDASVLAEHHGNRFTYVHEGAGQVAFEEKWLRQVLFNLLSNSLNVSPPNGVVTLRSVIENQRWYVGVEDQGPGLPPDRREKIFQRFVRFDTPKGADRGSGLGLAICRSIIGLHHGHISAEPGTDGKGLRVVFEIPTAPASISA